MTVILSPTADVSRRPTTIVAARAVAGVQVAIAVAATSLAGFGLIFLLVVTFDTSTGGERPSLVLPALLIVVAVLVSFLLLAALGRLRREEMGATRSVVALEVLLAAAVSAFVAVVGFGDPLVWAAPIVDLACCLLVVALLLSSARRPSTGTDRA